MTYQVLARKWRPKTFADLVGQDHVVRALVNALDQDRVHHAFLFTGTRGVGKTTVARIFARALNCEKGVSSNPCGECRACLDILDGRFLDLIEVDAASRTKVEDTRELLENVQYAPTSGRFKVYLIDEVHMLSTSSFNALLKTLEEPPPQVKFLFATTDPQKLPVTVLSRCLQFNLKRISQAQIEEYLQSITGQEDFEAEPDALKLLASAADGSMRDALSLLDQSVAYGAGQVRAQDVRAMLGTVQAKQLEDLLGALCSANAEGVWKSAQEMVSHSPDFSRVLGEIAQMFHRASVVQVMPSVDDADAVVQALARALSAEDLQLYYEIALHGRRDLNLAPDHRCGFEMTLLRMLAFTPGNGSNGGTGQAEPAKDSASSSPTTPSSSSSTSTAAAQTPTPENADPVAPPVAASTPASDPSAAKAEARRLAASIASGMPLKTAPSVQAPQEKTQETPVEAPQELPQAEPSKQVTKPAPDSTPIRSMDVHPPEPVAPIGAVEPELELAAPSVSESMGSPSMESENPQPPAFESEDPTLIVSSPPPVNGVQNRDQNRDHKVERLPDNTPGDDAAEQSSPTHSWDGIIDSLNLSGTAGVMARNSVLQREGQGQYLLTLDSRMEHLHTPQAEARIREGLARYFGKNMQLKIIAGELADHTPADRHTEATAQRQRSAEQAIDDDPLVQSLKQQMGAEVIPGSVRSRNS